MVETEGAPESQSSSTTSCINGHPIPSGKKFCTVCGSPAQEKASLYCANGHEVREEDKFCPECGAAVGQGHPEAIASKSPSGGAQPSAEQNGDRLGRKRWVVPVVVGSLILVIAAIVGIVIGASSSTTQSPAQSPAQSISYRDGYAYSSSIVNNGDDPGSASATCLTFEMPSGDDSGQWLSGCTDGYNQAIYNQDHPGAG